MIAKAGLGLVGLGAISMGGVAFTKPEWLGINKEIIWKPLSQDKDFKTKTTEYGSDKFGGKHQHYLVGLDAVNSDWWNKSFEQLKKDSLVGSGQQPGDKFKHTNESNANKGLNQICDEAYKSLTSNITSSGATDKYKEADIWKYCSPLGEKPKTIENLSEEKSEYKTEGWIGNKQKSKLVSITGNDKFWEIRDWEFKGKRGYEKIEKDSTDLFFKEAEGITIKDLCEKAYKQTAPTEGNSTTTAPTENQAVKYCSLEKK